MKHTHKSKIALLALGFTILAGTALGVTYENAKKKGDYSFGPESSGGWCHKIAITGTDQTTCVPVVSPQNPNGCQKSRTWTIECESAPLNTCVGSGTQTLAGSCVNPANTATCGVCYYEAWPTTP